jgi:hypothetical protein
MNADREPLVATNPFATRWVRPGAIAFHFPEHVSPATLLARLEALHGWGEIVGPHGSGKSTLLATLIPHLEQSGRVVRLFELHDGERCLPVRLRELSVDAATTVVVDGYEQLSWWHSWRLRSHVRRHGGGLIVTTHSSSGLPRLFETRVTLDLAQQLTGELATQHTSRVTVDDVSQWFATTHGNLRELFFALYDVHERRK